MPPDPPIRRWFHRLADRARHSLTLAQDEPDTFRLRMLTLIDRAAPDWVALSNLGRSRTIRSSYFWIMFVPICAQFLEPLPEVIKVPVLGPVQPALPFSWVAFFWMAIVFSAASLLFSLRCPAIVKSFTSYKDFAEEKHGELQLQLDFYETFHLSESRRWGVTPYQRFFGQLGNPRDGGNPLTKDQLRSMLDRRQYDLIYRITIPPANQPDAFTFLRLYAAHLRPWSRLACTLLYAAGFALAMAILLQNIQSVVRMTG